MRKPASRQKGDTGPEAISKPPERDAAPGEERSGEGEADLAAPETEDFDALPAVALRSSPAAPPSPADTGSWLVDELLNAPPPVEPAPEEEDVSEWGPGPAGDGNRDSLDEASEGDGGPDDTEAPQGDPPHAGLEQEPVPAGLREAIPELRRELAGVTVELDRLSGGIKAEVAAEVERRQEELAVRASAVAEEARASAAKVERRLSERLETGAKEDGERAARELQATATQLRSELSGAEMRLGTHLVDEVRAHAKVAERRDDALREAVRALSDRIDVLEDRLRAQARHGVEVAETLSVLARYRRHEPAEGAEERSALDLNAASFEDLRRAGLSSTQAARILSRRDALGGFDSVDRLREIPGLPAKLVERVAPGLSV